MLVNKPVIRDSPEAASSVAAVTEKAKETAIIKARISAVIFINFIILPPVNIK